MKQLKDKDLLGDSDTAVTGILEKLEKSPIDHKSIAQDLESFSNLLAPLSDRDRFFLSLDQLEFRGTLHCEACLASVLPFFTATLEDRQQQIHGLQRCIAKHAGEKSSFNFCFFHLIPILFSYNNRAVDG